MKPDVVVDVGNSRIKWGRCQDGRVTESVSLPPDDTPTWQRQLDDWDRVGPGLWAVSGVHPHWRDRLAQWLRERGDRVEVLGWRHLPLTVAVPRPDGVGIDRLLNAVAADSRCRRRTPAILIDAGSAVTVDWLDEAGAFRGGTILPGLRLMAQALHAYTALLPLVMITRPDPPLPGTSTTEAMEAGIYWAVAGGIKAICERLSAGAATPAEVFVTGGDGPLLHSALGRDVHLWPTMTLEGLRLAAEALP